MTRFLVSIPLVLMSACGAPRSPDVDAYERAVATATQRVQAYRSVVDSKPPATTCAAARSDYVEEMKARVENIRAFAPEMDGCFRTMGHDDMARVEHHCGMLNDEVEAYAMTGCASPNADVNRTEGLAHCERMLQALQDLGGLSGRLRGMMIPGGMMSADSCAP